MYLWNFLASGTVVLCIIFYAFNNLGLSLIVFETKYYEVSFPSIQVS